MYTHDGRQVIFHEIEILPFEETQMIENVNDVYDLFFRYRNAKNTKDKIDNLKPIIDLVIGDVKPDNASFFILPLNLIVYCASNPLPTHIALSFLTYFSNHGL